MSSNNYAPSRDKGTAMQLMFILALSLISLTSFSNLNASQIHDLSEFNIPIPYSLKRTIKVNYNDCSSMFSQQVSNVDSLRIDIYPDKNKEPNYLKETCQAELTANKLLQIFLTLTSSPLVDLNTPYPLRKSRINPSLDVLQVKRLIKKLKLKHPTINKIVIIASDAASISHHVSSSTRRFLHLLQSNGYHLYVEHVV